MSDPNVLLDELNALVEVRCSFLLSCGVYSGELTKEVLAELLLDWLNRGGGKDGLFEAIDGHRVVELSLDDGTTLYRSEGG